MDLKQANDILNSYIRPQTFPLALKLCTSEKELPEKARRPEQDLGYQVALCQAYGLARRYRWTLAVGKEDQVCIGGASAMGFMEQGSNVDSMRSLETGKYSHLLLAPIEMAGFEPDIVLIYGTPAQVMRLVQAADMGAGLSVSTVATGTGDCGDIVARTNLSDQCQFILPSGGDRIFGGTQDHEVIFAIPGSKVEAVLKGLEDTHRNGFRYPVLTDLRHSPALPPLLQIPTK